MGSTGSKTGSSNSLPVTFSPILVRSPRANSKFSPADRITNSPTLIKKTISTSGSKFKNQSQNMEDFSLGGSGSQSGGYGTPTRSSFRIAKTEKIEMMDIDSNIGGTDKGDNSSFKNLPVRKNRNVLTNIDDKNKKQSVFNNNTKNYKDFVITKAVKRESGNALFSLNPNHKDIEHAKNCIQNEYNFTYT